METGTVSTAAVQTVKGNVLTLYTGEEAWALLSKESFLSDWDGLYDTCPWATFFQSRIFVTTWYKVYRTKYLPIIVAAEYGGKLTGLLTFAIVLSNTKKGRIVGAGQFEAEYQSWLTEPSESDNFIKAALLKVQQQFPRSPIHLRYVTSQASLQWTKEPYWAQRCVLEPYGRPLMYMSDPEVDKIFRKSEFRKKRNRLQKKGKVEFERITTKEGFEAIWDDMMVMYDFRQGAKFNLAQFQNEPLKSAFYLALFEQGQLHVTALKVNGQLLAATAIMSTRDWMHLQGINIHVPFNADYYSPGLVHFIMLGQMLASDGVAVLDLTPGGDFYKDRLATRHDEVNEVVISSSYYYRLKRKLRQRYFERLRKAGKWPMGTMLAMRKKGYLLKARTRQIIKQGLLKSMIGKVRNVINPTKDKMYVIDAGVLNNSIEKFPVNKDSLRDMLCYEVKGAHATRWEFLEDAMIRFEKGGSAYSFSEDGRLLGCAWVKVDAKTSEDTNSNTESTIILQNLYCHPLGWNRLQFFLETVVQAVMKDQHAKCIYAQTQDVNMGKSLEAIGFRLTDKAME